MKFYPAIQYKIVQGIQASMFIVYCIFLLQIKSKGLKIFWSLAWYYKVLHLSWELLIYVWVYFGTTVCQKASETEISTNHNWNLRALWLVEILVRLEGQNYNALALRQCTIRNFWLRSSWSGAFTITFAINGGEWSEKCIFY